MEAVEGRVDNKLGVIEERMTDHFDKQIKTTNENMQVQFATQKKDIGVDFVPSFKGKVRNTPAQYRYCRLNDLSLGCYQEMSAGATDKRL